jgi:hypothetical protein
VTSASRSPDADTLEEYNRIFQSPLGSAQRKAIHALFTAGGPQATTDLLNVEQDGSAPIPGRDNAIDGLCEYTILECPGAQQSSPP